MELLQGIIQYVLDLGAAVFVPLLMFLVGIASRMKWKDAVNAAVILGVAFVGMNIVIGFMLDALTPAAQALVKRTGIQLNTIDGGWTSLATLAWAWPLAFLMFPLQMLINAVMLFFDKTKTLNVDLWNVWGKILTAVLVIGVTGNVYAAFVVAAVQMVIELILADVNQKQIEKITGIPGVTVSHSMMLFAVFLLPFNWIISKIPLFDKHVDADTLKEKMGVFAENHVMGFIIGLLLGMAGGYSVPDMLMLAIQAAAALTLFPMVAKLFMQALSPLSDAISEFMKNKFKNRRLFIGLDWPILAGSSEAWVAMILMVPVTLIYAVILPGNAILPFAGIINISFAVPALIITGGNLLRMLLLGIISTPVFLYIATSFAPTITQLAKDTNAVNIESGQMLSWSTLEYPVFRFIFAKAGEHIIWLIPAAVWLGFLVIYCRMMKKRTKELEKEETV
ncbi:MULTISPECIES: PTS galactitol transporter subunit IIC [Bacillus]|uniref:PTS galactitol transporter subunit IIC n=1 Tax=Bacillus glycinifermentans TaxID=1664069 RepID=A0AAJ4D4K2_9BACI|nr:MULTISPECIES: PTS transporter subunit IIC [Bacillus]KKB74498.1 PTS galactitol transporter subunit IIC [Bacillus sp. TH008]MDU0071578.1 PTS transporter subunit IIC [Bacillus sp. IG6]MED8021168.1 PTS transporter subunit IIC [Bacillus glycinifermentans]NUJ16724.1 PTS galactitol transporter subunit IIC [Bacillus glycinifermentans]QAT67575.1 PTS galactitol transporter subunit IIC [Bacillus glycinifermentans]